MKLPETVSREDWTRARKELLEKEKAHDRARDALSAQRRALPMVKLDKPYAFDGPDGRVALHELFGTHSQLIVYHFMFDPSWDEGCSSCTAGCDEISDGLLEHLRSRSTAFVVVARAPYPKIAAYKTLRGWTFPFVSSFGSDFNVDFHATIDESRSPLEINFHNREEIAADEASKLRPALEEEQPFEIPGFSFFLRDGADVFHTNSTYARGTESCSDSYGLLDQTALGRQEDWEEPKGRAEDPHDASPDFS
jgi:predicted dithiol-disulfide oxidoreductase (DUF899 family)